MSDTMQTIDWSQFAGETPDYFNPYNTPYPVPGQDTWASGGVAKWPDGSGPGVGKVVAFGGDDLSTYDPAKDILVFGFRNDDGSIREMNSHNYAVVFEK
ncbi:MAG: hypothetical protein AAF245_01600, partial [Pseudomonadota bacterium]